MSLVLQVPKPSLRWPFNESNVETITGLTPKSTLGTQTYIAGLYGQAIYFPNSATGGTPTSNIVYTLPSGFTANNCTISAWVKPYFNTSSGGGNQHALALTDSSRGVSINMYGSPKPYIYIINQGDLGFGSAPDVPTQTWFHASVVFSNVNSSNPLLTYYFNGNSIASLNYNIVPSSFFSTLTVGSVENSLGGNFAIQDVRLYNTALSAVQIQALYTNQGVPQSMTMTGQSASPSLLWSFNGTMRDSITGLTFQSAQSYAPALYGRLGAAFSNVTGQYISSVSLNPTIATSPGLTISLWFKPLPGLAGQMYFFGLYNTAIINPKNGNPMEIAFIFESDGLKSVYNDPGANFTGATFVNSYVSNNWYHLCVVFNNLNLYHYTNGKLVGAPVQYSLETIGSNAFTSTTILNYGAPYGRQFTLSDARVYNSALSNAQVQSIYNQSTVPVTSISMTGAPLFSQISPAAQSSAMGAFSLRAVNGLSPSGTARAVNVLPGASFPPSPFTSAATQSVNQYTQSLSGYPFGGSGTYVANTSTVYNGSLVGWKAFSQLYNTNGVWASVTGGYSSSSPYTYTGSVSTTDSSANSYGGEWIQLQTPNSIILRSYTISNGADSGAVGGQSPTKWWVLGSTTGLNGSWVLIDTQTGITWSGALCQTKTFTTSQTSSYTYFRVVINQVSGYVVGVVQLSGVSFVGSVSSFAADFYADRLGNLLTAPVTGQTLSSWLGGATGYVATWYDQSGKGNDASQATLANQPQINLATSPYSLIFNGSTTNMVNSNFTFNFGTSYKFSVRAVVNNTTGGCLLYKGTVEAPWNAPGQKKWWLGDQNGGESSTNGYPNQVGNSEGYIFGQGSAITSAKTSVTWSVTGYSTTDTSLVSLYENASTTPITYSGRSGLSQRSDPGNYLYIGTGGNSTNYGGNIYEIEIFSSSISASDVTIMG
jgi:hypothetical protein